MTARSQGHSKYQPQTPTAQLLRERQRFFEDVLDHDVDLCNPQIHLLREHWRPPLDSVSSMEVNIDSLELSDPLDVSELDPYDAFQQSEESLDPLSPPADLENSKLVFPASAELAWCFANDEDTSNRAKKPPCVPSLENGKTETSIPDPPSITHFDHINTTGSELE